MKQKLLILFGLAVSGVYAQSGVNSGAVSGNSLIYSVGEIYVLPVGNPNGASSGTIGAISRIEFLGIDEIAVTEKGIKVYPNPTAHSVYFETTEIISNVEVYDTNGRLVISLKPQNNQADLSILQSGTYIIRTNNNQSFKVIKK
ncbi:hypothetical protein HYN59_13430 [Flavobacterium album]|uniref:Secretion system C-terminal sorting domain-containing protein n=1 Tax=Flavobacterium album TaxID=2175091 RepID=A0A2S1R0K4_9FLAO|nr:T9SS type A sorting domain-containing protein [Flavobacterium album]AWH86051.1 hypothetical protein HYN59_13430 [Flavobacterium album]